MAGCQRWSIKVKKVNRFGLVQGFIRRWIILFLIYFIVMASLWSTITPLLDDDGQTHWIFWVIVGASIIGFITLIITVEVKQRQANQ
jgi:hypothetical protein